MSLEYTVPNFRITGARAQQLRVLAEAEARARGEARPNIGAVVRRALIAYLDAETSGARLKEQEAVNSKWLPH